MWPLPCGSQPIKGGQVKTPVLKLRGEELKQPPVIDAFIKQMRFPLTLSWPDQEVRPSRCQSLVYSWPINQLMPDACTWMDPPHDCSLRRTHCMACGCLAWRQVDHDICMATVASEERSEWAKALNKTLKVR